jgi:hypothetical protein
LLGVVAERFPEVVAVLEVYVLAITALLLVVLTQLRWAGVALEVLMLVHLQELE